MRRTTGFTLIELLVVIAIITLLIGLLVPALASARRGSKSMTDGNQQKQIHLAFLTFANGNDGGLPVPGLIDPNPVQVGGQPREIPGQGPEAFEHNWTGPLFSAMVAQDFFGTDILYGPTETNPVVGIYKNYDYRQYDPADDDYWDPNLKVDIAAPPGEGVCHVSFAHAAICGRRKNRRWRDTQDSTYPIIGTRGVKDGLPPGEPEHDTSPTLRLHGPKRLWVGNIVFADNHWQQISNFYPQSTTYKLNDGGGDAVKDNIFDAEFDNEHPDDSRAVNDAWLVISTSAALDGLTVTAKYDAP